MLRPGHATIPSTYLPKFATRRTLKTKNIEARSPPQFLSIRSLTVCRIAVSPKHIISYSAYCILNDRSHVLYLPTHKRFKAILDSRYDETQEGLWIRFTGNLMQGKRVVRSWATRRIEQAVTEALKMRGFDRNGKKLAELDASIVQRSRSNSSPVQSTPASVLEALVGTVEVRALHNSVETSFNEVQRQANVIVDKILEICGRCPDGRRHDRPQRSGKHHTAKSISKDNDGEILSSGNEGRRPSHG